VKASFTNTAQFFKSPADLASITKIDLAAAVEFNVVEENHNMQVVRPGLIVLEVSANFGRAMESFLDFPQATWDAARLLAIHQSSYIFATSESFMIA
jgi:Ni2+-binding GTPase involved in maturation of urease and hydrogenase